MTVNKLQQELNKERQARLQAEARVEQLERELERTRPAQAPFEQKKLQAANTYLSILLASLPFGILVQDETGRIVLANQGFCDLFDLKQAPDTLTGADWRGADQNARGYYEDPEQYAERLASIRRNRQPVVGEVLTLKSGRSVTRDYVPIEIDGLARGELFLFRDRTEDQKREEAIVKARDAAETANRAKATFLASMSHEMRTPLSAVLGIADLLFEGDLSPEQSRLVSRISSNADALRVLIEDILDFAKLEAGQFQLHEEPFSPRAVIRDVVDRLTEPAQAASLTLQENIAPDVPEVVLGDEARVGQLLSNLIGNAIKFTEEGSITVSLELDPATTDGALRYAVQDTGPGIAPEAKELIFQRFYRGASETPGTGLGLSIGQHLAQLMGGQLRVESEEGQGACFFFAVPHALCEEPLALASVRPSVLQSEAPSGGQKTLLLAEDDDDNRGLIARFIERAGYRVDQAQDGEVAREKLKARKYDGLVSDLSMPHLDGFGLLSWLRKREVKDGLPRLPALVVTAHALPEHQRLAHEVGADGFLTKPIKAQTLWNALQRVFDEPLRILAIDDAADARMLLEHQLRRTFPDAIIVMRDSGASGLKAAEETHFDAVLIDVEMPDLDGRQTVGLLRARRAYEDTPMIATTAHTAPEEHRRCIEAGFDRVLTKPLVVSRVQSILNKLLKQRSESQPMKDTSSEASTPGVEKVTVGSDLADLVPQFIGNRRSDIEKLRQGLKESDWVTLKRLGHGMKGTGGAYGFPAISEWGKAIEEAALAKNAAQIEKTTGDLEAYLKRVVIEVAS